MCFRWPWRITPRIRTTQTSPPRAPRGLVVGLPPPSWCCSPRWLWPLFSSTGPDWVDWPRWTQKPAQVTLWIQCWLSLITLISQSTHPPTQKQPKTRFGITFQVLGGKTCLKRRRSLSSILLFLSSVLALQGLWKLWHHTGPFTPACSGRTPQTRVVTVFDSGFIRLNVICKWAKLWPLYFQGVTWTVLCRLNKALNCETTWLTISFLLWVFKVFRVDCRAIKLTLNKAGEAENEENQIKGPQLMQLCFKLQGSYLVLDEGERIRWRGVA